MTDESFALGMNKQNYTDGILSFPWFNGVNLFSYASWVFATLIGAILGSFIPNPNQFGLEFAVIAMFIGLLYLQVINDRTKKLSLQLIVIGLVCLLFYVGLIFIPTNLLILLVTLVCCGLGMVVNMSSFSFVFLTVAGCACVTWLSRVFPFVLIKHFNLPKPLLEYLDFVPIVIMSALWFSNLFVQKIGHLPSVNWFNFFASIPTLIVSVLTKNLLLIVLTGIISLTLLQMLF